MPRVLDTDERFELLAKIAKDYPDEVSTASLGVTDAGVLRATLKHLEENSFVDVKWIPDGSVKVPVWVKSTARGYDFCEGAGYFEEE